MLIMYYELLLFCLLVYSRLPTKVSSMAKNERHFNKVYVFMNG